MTVKDHEMTLGIVRTKIDNLGDATFVLEPKPTTGETAFGLIGIVLIILFMCWGIHMVIKTTKSDSARANRFIAECMVGGKKEYECYNIIHNHDCMREEAPTP